MLTCSAALHAQAGSVSLRVTVVDSTSARGLSGALVEARSGTATRRVRTDAAGEAEIRSFANGLASVDVVRIGYSPTHLSVQLARDTALTVRLAVLPHQLATVRVTGRGPAFVGHVGSATNALPLSGAMVQAIGSGEHVVTDSSGGFYLPLKHSGTYVVHVTRDGFQDQLITATVSGDATVELSALLDSGSAQNRGLLWADFDERARWLGQGGALVPASELAKHDGGDLSDALRASHSVVNRSLRIGPNTCLFVDGEPKPGWTIDAIPVDQVAAVEVYTSTGDQTQSLARRWPPNALCGSGVSDPDPSMPPSVRRSTVRFAVVWLKR